MSTPIEAERKLLIAGQRPAGSGRRIAQGYLSTGTPEVRVRITDDEAELTIKGAALPSPDGVKRRPEVSVPLAPDAATAAFGLTGARLQKTRYVMGPWEIDVFDGALTGLMLAELETPPADGSLPPLPGALRVIADVSMDPRFENRALASIATPADFALLLLDVTGGAHRGTPALAQHHVLAPTTCCSAGALEATRTGGAPGDRPTTRDPHTRG